MKDTSSPDMTGAWHALSDRTLAAWEIVSVVSSVLIVEWLAAAVAGLSLLLLAVPVVLAFTLMAASHRERSETPNELGFRFDNFGRAFLMLLPPMIAVTLVFLAIGRLSGSGISILRWGAARPLFLQLILGTLWGLAQQYVLQGFINRRAVIIFGRGWISVLLVAVIFGALHLPNLWLAGITFVGGVIWSATYQRTPNLFALAVSHSIMTWVVISTISPSALHHLRVGFGYFL